MREAGVDLVLLRGRIWTEDPKQPEAEAVAIVGNRVFAVGATAEIEPLAGARTRVIDLHGRRVVPGFNDAHVHFSTGGFSLTSVNLRSARNETEFRDILARFVQSRPKGEWILQGEWDPENWPSGRLPSAKLIDDITRDHPVFLNRVDAHTMLANSAAMTLAGVTKATADVSFGSIGRYDDGTPTGIFVDGAQTLIARAIPPPSAGRFLEAIRAAQEHAAAHGVTSIQDMGLIYADDETRAILFSAYQTLLRQNELKVRVSLHTPLPDWERLARVGVMAGFGSEMLQIGRLKSFSDGSLGSRTAWFFDPYLDAPGTHGSCSDELADMHAMYAQMRSADASGLQLAIHAIGDRANSVVLDLIERLQAERGDRDRRVRIEHAQHLRPADLARFAGLRVIASVQPAHCIDDARFVEKRIGKERAKTTYAFRSLLNAGARLAFGSDWWVAPIDPMIGVYAAVTRAPLDGSHHEGWMPAEKMSVAQAVHAYTVGSAYASFDEQSKGSIAIGKLADIAVLSEDIFRIAPEQIRAVKTDMTIFNGAVVFDSSNKYMAYRAER